MLNKSVLYLILAQLIQSPAYDSYSAIHNVAYGEVSCNVETD